MRRKESTTREPKLLQFSVFFQLSPKTSMNKLLTLGFEGGEFALVLKLLTEYRPVASSNQRCRVNSQQQFKRMDVPALQAGTAKGPACPRLTQTQRSCSPAPKQPLALHVCHARHLPPSLAQPPQPKGGPTGAQYNTIPCQGLSVAVSPEPVSPWLSPDVCYPAEMFWQVVIEESRR